MKMNSKIFYLILSLLLFTGGISSARMDKKWHKYRGYEHGKKSSGYIGIPWKGIMIDLELTDKQKTKIKDLKYKSERNSMKLMNEMKLKMFDFKYLLSMYLSDKVKTDKLIDEMGELHKKKLRNKVDSLSEFKSIFNKEQWDKIQAKGMDCKQKKVKQYKKKGKRKKQ